MPPIRRSTVPTGHGARRGGGHRVRRRLVALSAAIGLAAAGVCATAPGAQADTGQYYLALGDSLAAGYQGAHDGVPAGDTGDGYVDDVYARLHQGDPGLQLVNLGCDGETTGTMIADSKCSYPEGSQLDAATAFLRAHPGQVRYLTIDIGANDVDGCAPGGSIDTACVLQGIGTIAKNLNTILDALRAAGGGTALSVGMNYYDPFLQYWTTGLTGKLVATASVGLLAVINTTEQLLYAAHGFTVANVFGAFKTADFLPASLGADPVNVQAICRLTYMCTQHNIHPTTAGYALIASAFESRLR